MCCVDTDVNTAHIKQICLQQTPQACVIGQKMQLATCINYADLNNSMLRMCGHVSAGFFRCDILFLQGKHSGFRHIVAIV